VIGQHSIAKQINIGYITFMTNYSKIDVLHWKNEKFLKRFLIVY